MNDLKGWLFGRVLRLQGPTSAGRWRQAVFNVDTGHFEGVGQIASPLLAPAGLRVCGEIVVFSGNPPDPVTLGGDYVYLAPYEPNFTLGPNGDLTLLEGSD